MAKTAEPQPKMSGAELVGRVLALEAFVVELAAMGIAPLPDSEESAALARVGATAKERARGIGHGVAETHTDHHVDVLTKAVQSRLDDLRAKP